jgi:parvulin-like peptidyl-prolyl isomerase
MIEGAMKKNKKTREQVIEGIEKQGLTLEMFYRRNRVRLLRKALATKGSKLAQDPGILKKMYAEHPEEFNGTKVVAQHVLVWVFPHDTPEDIEKKRERIESIRKRLLAGQITWDDAQTESRSGLGPVARLGWIPRHPPDVNEALTETAFKTPKGETSAVVRSGAGFHFVQVLERTEGNRPLDNADTRAEMQHWLERKFLFEAGLDAEKNHPVVGVRPPARTPIMAQREYHRPPPMRFGSSSPPPATKPAGKK